jgi:uncharacterized repeat protein (TIGR03803 family)
LLIPLFVVIPIFSAKLNLQPEVIKMRRPGLFLVASVTAAVIAAVTTIVFYELREMPPARYSVIHRFSISSDGSGPVPGLAMDAADNLYGMTFIGGKRSGGSIFKLTPPPPLPQTPDPGQSNASGETPVWSEQVVGFDANKVGGMPESPMIFDQAGTLYGITSDGGPPPNAGTLFKLEAPERELSGPVRLYSMPVLEFNDHRSELVSDASGALYGTTSGRGASSTGTVFKLSSTSEGWTMVTLYGFKGDDDGAYPTAGLVFDRSGALYGTTSGGGKDGIGTVFKLTRTENGWHETVIHTFHQPDRLNGGVLPMAGLTVDAAGTLYGTTGGGGELGGGTIFTLTRSGKGWTYRVLYNFSGETGNGDAPNSRLVFGASGELYGTTRYGGVAQGFGGKGTVFRLAPTLRLAPTWFGWKQTTIHSFAGGMDGDGSSTRGELSRSKSGRLFGVTSSGGGPGNNGALYEIVP